MNPRYMALAVFASGILTASASPVTENVLPRWVRVAAAVVGLGLTHLLYWLSDPQAFARKLGAQVPEVTV